MHNFAEPVDAASLSRPGALLLVFDRRWAKYAKAPAAAAAAKKVIFGPELDIEDVAG
jgi:hypothetical protein